MAAEPDAQGSRSLVRIAVRTGEKRYITNPPAGWRGDSLPVFAPDSASVAFRRTTALSGHEDVYTVPIGGGTVKRITFDDTGVSGVAFLNDGRLLVSSKREGPIRGLWCYGPGGKRSPRLTATTVDAGPAIVSRDGRRLALIAYSFDVNIWRVPAAGGAPATVLIASELPDSSPQYSPDGGRLAFCSMRSGSDGIWVSDSNGANETRLFDGKGMPVGAETWSPDGRQLAFEWHPTKNAEIHIMPAGGGRSRPLVVDQFNNRVPVWSHDGAFVYFASNRTGTWAIFQVPAAGGPLTQLTSNGASFAALSPTGDALYSITEGAGPKGSGIRQLWRTSLHGGTPELVCAELVPPDWNNWVPVENGIYLYAPPQSAGTRDRVSGLRHTQDAHRLRTEKAARVGRGNGHLARPQIAPLHAGGPRRQQPVRAVERPWKRNGRVYEPDVSGTEPSVTASSGVLQNWYPTPRMVLMRSSPPSSFLRRWLMCMSMERSNGVALRL